MYKHKPFIAENSKNWKGHGENETSTVGNRKQSPHAFYDAFSTYSKVLKVEKSLELAWYANMREKFSKQSLALCHEMLFWLHSTSYSRLHCWNCIFLLSAQPTMSILQVMPSLTVVNLSTLTSLLPLPTSAKVSWKSSLLTPPQRKMELHTTTYLPSPPLDNPLLQESAWRLCYTLKSWCQVKIKLISKGEGKHPTTETFVLLY